MKYDVDKRPTEHTISLTTEDVEQAIQGWAERNAPVVIPDSARLHLSLDSVSGKIVGRICWEGDDED